MVMEKSRNIKICKNKSWNFVISHGILPILSLNLIKCMPYLPTLSHLVSVYNIRIFQPSPQNVANAKLGHRHNHGKLRNGHGKQFFKVCGNPEVGRMGIQHGY